MRSRRRRGRKRNQGGGGEFPLGQRAQRTLQQHVGVTVCHGVRAVAREGRKIVFAFITVHRVEILTFLSGLYTLHFNLSLRVSWFCSLALSEWSTGGFGADFGRSDCARAVLTLILCSKKPSDSSDITQQR